MATSRAEWAKRVERWRDSGLTAKQFAAETGLKPSTLTYWKWKLRDADSSSEPSAVEKRIVQSQKRPQSPAFVELKSVASAEVAAPLELQLGERLTLRVPTGFDEDTLIRVLRVCGALP